MYGQQKAKLIKENWVQNVMQSSTPVLNTQIQKNAFFTNSVQYNMQSH